MSLFNGPDEKRQFWVTVFAVVVASVLMGLVFGKRR